MTATMTTAADLSGRLDTVLPVLREQADAVDTAAAFPERSVAALRESGLMGLLVPTGYGGLGGDLRALVSVAGALAGECMSTAMIWAMHCQQVVALVQHGSPQLRERLLPRIAAGEVYVASVTSERGKGGHLFTAEAPLRRRGGRVLLERDAPIVTGGHHADGFLITMRDSESAGYNSVTLVYADRAELTVTPGDGSWNPMGMRGTHSGPVKLTGEVDESSIVGEPGAFRTVAVSGFVPVGHVAWAGCWIGGAQAALRSVLELVRSPAGRKQFDLDSELLRARLARARLDLDTMAALLAQVIRDIDQGGDPEDVPVQLRLNGLKVHTAERSLAVIDLLIEIVGLRFGYMRGTAMPLERLFRDLRSASLNYANDRLLQANGTLALLDRAVTLTY
ncbi:acyl-CoA/acyl-ACP dehydrogenase [Amycolatopsis sp. NBC_00345]|uniref:acyl-CoA dehydrogenase family protein n=1 Tax=Amycolatopsis sp. NBC_00345 TaxID=2975955 RepID=UPI002E268498